MTVIIFEISSLPVFSSSVLPLLISPISSVPALFLLAGSNNLLVILFISILSNNFAFSGSEANFENFASSCTAFCILCVYVTISCRFCAISCSNSFTLSSTCEEVVQLLHFSLIDEINSLSSQPSVSIFVYNCAPALDNPGILESDKIFSAF